MKTGIELKDSLKNIHNRLSKSVKLRDVAGVDTEMLQGSLSTNVTDLVTDSRRVVPGSAF